MSSEDEIGSGADLEGSDDDQTNPETAGTLIHGLSATAGPEAEEEDLFAHESEPSGDLTLKGDDEPPKKRSADSKARTNKPRARGALKARKDRDRTSGKHHGTAVQTEDDGKRAEEDTAVELQPRGDLSEGSGDEYDESDVLAQGELRAPIQREPQRNILVRCGRATLWTLFEVLSSSWLNFSLATSPFTLLCWFFNWPAEAMFILALVSFIGLGQLLRLATDQLVYYVPKKAKPFVRLQWALPFILACVAMSQDFSRLAQTVLVGPILYRLTITNGLTYFVTLTRRRSKPDGSDGKNAKQAISILLFVLFCIFIPALLSASIGSSRGDAGILRMSRWDAMLLLVLGVPLYYFFSYRSENTPSRFWADLRKGDSAALGLISSILTVAVVVAISTLQCAAFITSVQKINDQWGLSFTFMGMVLLTIALNACHTMDALRLTFESSKHLDAIVMNVCRDSIELGLFALPLVVVVSWISAHGMGMDFYLFESVATWIAALILHLVAGSRSNYLLGGVMLISYLVLCVAFFFHPDN